LPAPPANPPPRAGFSVGAPILIYKVDPVYSPEARTARFSGTVVLEAVVQTDGTVKINRVVRSLGMGLDEAAIEALSQWRFNPATKDGVTVPVMLNIEVNFNAR
jgi:TonB family protein